MKIALGQIEVIPGKPEINVKKMLSFIEQAKAQQCDIVAFPEMCVSGYLLGDLWLDDEYCRYLMSFNEQIREASDGIAIIYGNVYLYEEINPDLKINKDGCDGRTTKFNAAYLYHNKQPVKRCGIEQLIPVGIQPKTLLPNYRIFDDKRYFTSPLEWLIVDSSYITQICQPFEIEIKGKKTRIALEICEDLWQENYYFNPTKVLSMMGAEVIINISASPWTYGKNEARDRRVKNTLEWNNNSPLFYYVNCIGKQSNGKNIVTFDGGSTVYNKDGFPRIFAKESYKEELLICDPYDLPKEPIERKEESKISQKYKALCQGIKYITEITNTKKFVIGLSGGIDSAVAACLCQSVVGPENIIAVNMPTENNSEKTQNAAKQIAENLGIRYEIMPIQDLFINNSNAISDKFSPATQLNLENEQARIRSAMILAGVAARENALFTNNGNKLEAALGYCTYLGDLSGSIAILGDMLKTEIFELGEYINRDREIIPKTLFPDELYRFSDDTIASGPELIKGQVSKLKIGYHDYLVAAIMDYKKTNTVQFLEWYLDDTIEDKLSYWGYKKGVMKRYGLDNPQNFLDDLTWFCKQYYYNVWKRIQMPPVCVVSKTAFGHDLRESQIGFIKSQKYLKLEQKIKDK
jgi:NAD+ synthase (glutamine-hydrolysing)